MDGRHFGENRVPREDQNRFFGINRRTYRYPSCCGRTTHADFTVGMLMANNYCRRKNHAAIGVYAEILE